jgi:hypothetical protein
MNAALTIHRKFESIIPILDIGNAVWSLSIAAQCRMNDWELRDLGWEEPINYGLVNEPFIITNKTKWRGFRYSHLMIGDLENEFKNGTTEVYVNHKPWCGPSWMLIHERVTSNIRELAKWTVEVVELRPDYC